MRLATSTEIAVGTEALNKPFMDYLLKNSEFDRDELEQLKRKINQIKSKEAKENLEVMRRVSRERLVEVLQPILSEETLQRTGSLEDLLDIIAGGCNREEIIRLVSPEENADDVLARINELLQDSQDLGRRSEAGLIEDILRSLEDLNKSLMNKPEDVRKNRLANVKISIDRVFRIFGIE